jgi:hypothetical protein
MGSDRCSWVQARLPLLAGDDWLGLDRRRVERHLIACTRCRQRLDRLNSVVTTLRAVGESTVASKDSTPPPSLWPALARQIRESRRKVPTWSSSHLTRLPLRAGLAASLFFAVLALGARQDIRSQVTRLIVSITHRTLPSNSPRKRVTIQIQPPTQDIDDSETILAETSGANRARQPENNRAAFSDAHSTEPTR